MSDTPKTNHLWGRLSLMKWGRTDMPVSLIMESHEQLERELAAEKEQVAILQSDCKRLGGFAKTYRRRADEAEDKLAAERALADRLAETIQSLPAHVKTNINPQALAAWKEVRHGTV